MNLKQKFLAAGGILSGAVATMGLLASKASATVLDATTTIDTAGTDASDTFKAILEGNIPKIVGLIVILVGFGLLVRMFRRHAR